MLIEDWRHHYGHYNAVRPHGSLRYRPPAPEALTPSSWPAGSAAQPSMR